MKTKELIKRLQELDPEANVQVALQMFHKRYPVYFPLDNDDYLISKFGNGFAIRVCLGEGVSMRGVDAI